MDTDLTQIWDCSSQEVCSIGKEVTYATSTQRCVTLVP